MRKTHIFLSGLSFVVLYVYLSFVPALSAELIMFEARFCYWCKIWDKEVGSVYQKTKVGRNLPLRKVDINQRPDDLKYIKRIIYSPTFVLVNNKVEVGRIQGYPGEDFFWGQLNVLIKNIPKS